MVRRNDDLGLAGASSFVLASGILVVLAGLALAGFRFIGGIPPEQGDSVEGALGSIALGATIAVPGVLAILALRDRPVLLLPAGIALVPLSFLSFAGLTLPLLIPAVMLVIAYGRRSSGHPPPKGTAAGTVAAVFLMLAASVAVLFLHEDPRSYSTATGGGSTSDVITYAESLPSIALSVGAAVAGWFLAGPRQRFHPPIAAARGRLAGEPPN